jgi:hypothetical protein
VTAPAPTPPSAALPAPAENPTPTEAVPPKQDEPPKEAPKAVQIEVDSDPSGAEVWLPGDTEARGHTPFKVALDSKAAPARVIIKAHGYADKTVKLDPANPDPVSVTLDRSASHDHDTGMNNANAGANANAGNKKKGSGNTGGKKDPSGYKMMGD